MNIISFTISTKKDISLPNIVLGLKISIYKQDYKSGLQFLFAPSLLEALKSVLRWAEMSGYTPNKRSGSDASMPSLTNWGPVKSQQKGKYKFNKRKQRRLRFQTYIRVISGHICQDKPFTVYFPWSVMIKLGSKAALLARGFMKSKCIGSLIYLSERNTVYSPTRSQAHILLQIFIWLG